MRRLGPLVLLLYTAACGGGSSPTTPSSSESTSQNVRGQTVDAITGVPAGDLTVSVGSYRSVTTDANGMFTFDGAHAGTFPATLRGSSMSSARRQSARPLT